MRILEKEKNQGNEDSEKEKNQGNEYSIEGKESGKLGSRRRKRIREIRIP